MELLQNKSILKGKEFSKDVMCKFSLESNALILKVTISDTKFNENLT